MIFTIAFPFRAISLPPNIFDTIIAHIFKFVHFFFISDKTYTKSDKTIQKVIKLYKK